MPWLWWILCEFLFLKKNLKYEQFLKASCEEFEVCTSSIISITTLHCRQTKTIPVSIYCKKTPPYPTHCIVPRLRTTSILFSGRFSLPFSRWNNSADAGMPQPSPTKARGNNRLPGIMTLGYIAAFGNPTKAQRHICMFPKIVVPPNHQFL